MANSASVAQLERMGVELKCPICLSLFNQAASLTCNHSFCTACILQSMKGTSCCPICKVPATRREVRGAPQMDSLVAIFKGMQTSAGLHLFQTQPSQPTPFAVQGKQAFQEVNVPDPQPKGRKKRAKVSSIAANLENMNLNHPKTRRRRQPVSVLSNVTNLDQNHATGGATANKNNRTTDEAALQSMDSDAPIQRRVQGPRPQADIPTINEYPAQTDENYGVSLNPHAPNSVCRKGPSLEGAVDIGLRIVRNRGCAKAGLTSRVFCSQIGRGQGISRPTDSASPESLKQRCSPITLQQRRLRTESPHVASLVEQPQLAPFFWLRDDVLPSQEERLTQTQLTGRALPLRPSFSDLKDSDDEQSDDAPNQDVGPCPGLAENAFSAPDSCDSDTFIWTQRLGSPELSCSPVKDNKRVFPQEEKVSKEQGVPDNESKSPIKSVEDPATVQATQTPQLLQEPARMGRGTLSKCSRSQKSARAQAFIKACRSLRSSDPSSLPGSSTRPVILPLKAATPTTSDAEEKDRNTISTGFRLETSAGTDEASKSVDILSDENIETLEEGIYDNPAVDLGKLESCEDNRQGKRTSDGELRHKANNQSPVCVFCGSAGDSKVAGKMTEFKDTFSSQGLKTVHVHKLCAEWAPDVYFEENVPKNLACEVTRGQKIKCSRCGKRGAALGCCNKRCKRSFHYPCARVTPGCKWDKELPKVPEEAAWVSRQMRRYVNGISILHRPALECQHVDCNFPKRRTMKKSSSKDHQSTQEDTAELSLKSSTPLESSSGRQTKRWPAGPACKWVICGSGLSPEMKGQMAVFAALTGASLVKRWSPCVTHVITGAEMQGAARRTLKFLMAILESKWIVKFEWMLECMTAGYAIGEQEYEVTADINGFTDGPKRSRALAASKAPKLLEGLSFYLYGDFTAITKQDLQSLIAAGRGVVLHRKPLHHELLPPKGQDQLRVPQRGQTIVIYDGDKGNLGQLRPESQLLKEAMSVARPAGAKVVPHTWLLDSVAACMLQPVA